MKTSGLLQLHGCIKRTCIEKCRNWRSTCCECFSHLIILGILIIGYGLSVVTTFSAQKYTDIELSIPLRINNSVASLAFLEVSTGPLAIPDLDQYIEAQNVVQEHIRVLAPYAKVLSSTVVYTNLVYKGSLHFAPQGADTDSLIAYMNETFSRFSSLNLYIHKDENEGVNYILNELSGPALALIVLHQITPAKVNFEIRQNYTTIPNTNQVLYDTEIGLNMEYLNYFFSGFLTLEMAVNEWAFNYTNALNRSADPAAMDSCTGPPKVMLVPYPTAEYNQNPFYQQVGFLLGLAIVTATMYPVSRVVTAVVEERELRLKEVLKIMGLKDWVHQLSWFITALVLFTWIAISCAFLARQSFLVHSSGLLVYAYFWLFAMSEISFAFLVSVFFSNSKVAALVAPAMLFAGLLPRYSFLNTNNNEAVVSKYLCSLLAPSAFAMGADMLAEYEYSGVGLQFSNAGQGGYNFYAVLFMMLVDFLFYGLLAWYLGQVVPHEHGSAQQPLFFLRLQYWWPRSFVRGAAEGKDTVGVADLQEMPEFHGGESEDDPSDGNVEPIPSDLRPLAHVRIKNLRKRFPDGNLAVRDLSMSMLQGQITCLLGHNGAGKTTTIAALTGLMEATGGEVSIYGHSLHDDLPAIRQLTGICPQHNVLYPSLTVHEHLSFFGNVKGLQGPQLLTTIDDLLDKVGLTEKRDAQSAALSGGMKRKLSLAIALIGDPKFLLLDEPTSGMDPYSRRSTWELLQRCKAGRVVLLTTHFMEEADTLADRIAILSEGSLRCSGSSLFLKKRFGAGYVLSLSKVPAADSAATIDAAVKHMVTEAVVASTTAGEVVYRLPLAAVPQFADLFGALREKADGLGITSYGISLTTLEQVFIALARDAKLHSHEVLDDHADEWQYWVQRHLRTATGGLYSACVALYPSSPPVTPDPAPSRAAAALDDDAAGISLEGGRVLDLNDAPQRQTAMEDVLKMPTITGSSEPKQERGTLFPAVTASDGLSQVSFAVQLVELYRKRYIMASRDLKGLFFQLVFPALQIALIMFILTIDLKPPGRTIILNADMFPRYASISPTVEVAGPLQDDPYRQGLDPYSMVLTESSAVNSSVLSDIMLTTSSGDSHRLGAFVFGDRISVYLTVDWSWVQENLSGLNETIVAIPGGENAVNAALTASMPLHMAQSLAQLQHLVPSGLQRHSNLVRGSHEAAVDVGSADYSAAADILTLHDVTVTAGNHTVQLNELRLTPAQLAQLLPNETVSYELAVPSRYTVMHNSTSPHGAAAFYSELVATAFQQCSPAGTTSSTEYLVKNHPLPIPPEDSLDAKTVLAILTAQFILIRLCYVPASFVAFLVKERVSKSKHLQLVSSVSPSTYWIATYTWDMSMYCTLVGLVMAALYLFYDAAEVYLYTSESTLALLCLLLTYGLSAMPLSYLYSMLFDNFSTAQIAIMIINIMTGFVMVLGYYIMTNIPETKEIGLQLVHLFRFFPPYNVGEGLINLSLAYYHNSMENKDIGPFDWDCTGRNIVFMLIEGVGFFLAVLLTEWSPLQRLLYRIEMHRVARWPPPPPPRHGEDADVTAEQRRVQALRDYDSNNSATVHALSTVEEGAGAGTVEPDNSATTALLLQDLVKTYPSSLLGGAVKHAVRGVSLACAEGERFGLLGINGAGKTTILGIMTGDLQPTAGEVYIAGKALSDPATLGMIGYCPQVDPLLDLMNAYETLWFYGRIRGIAPDLLQQRVHELIHQMGLDPYAHKPCGTYSGGNKRKLSLAVALVGDPRVLLLDEPSTGMDPEARRNMWTVIEKLSAKRCVVLVSHSMEEVEALCTRVGVMVSGRLQCIGSVQHLKGRFGSGYQVEIRTTPAQVPACVALCEQVMSPVVVEEVHGGYVRLKVKKDVDLAVAFSTLESHKAALEIADYSVSQCTLEQVFLQFAKDQEEETGPIDGMPNSVIKPEQEIARGLNSAETDSGAAAQMNGDA